jgi:site-specific recombinase XerD
MKASAYLIHATRHKKRSGKSSVKIRVVYHRKPKDFKTDFDLSEDEYKNAMVERPKGLYKDINIKLRAIEAKARKTIEDIGIFTFQKFENAFYSSAKGAGDIYPYFEEYIKLLNSEGRLKTRDSYQSAMNSLKQFKNSFGFYDISPNFLKRYETWMVNNGNTKTTVGIYTRNLRSIYNYGISKNVIKKDENYPFGKRKYVIPSGSNKKKALSQDEVSLIYKYQTTANSSEDKAKDFWMFSYLCNGINFKDIALMKVKCIDGDMLRFVRAKTENSTREDEVIISCYLNEYIKSIIAKWRSGNTAKEDYLFDVLQKSDDLEEQKRKIAQFIKNTNKYMKRISMKIGIGKNVTTYYGRHSAATIMKKSGAHIEQIREALGHQSTSTTQKYLDSFDDESKKELSKSLTHFI